jgi:glycosyltransferase involved in cell wall biosynthesis
MNHDPEISRMPAGAAALLETLSRQLDDCEREGELLDRVESLERLLGPAICRQLAIYRLPSSFLLSVIIPVFNEERTVSQVIDRVRACGLPCEIIVVDDGSTDDTRGVLAALPADDNLRVVHFAQNAGKGAALKAGFEMSRGDVVVVQDADLEYDPNEIWRLIQPIVEGQADVVFGSRFRGDSRRVVRLWHMAGNQLLTLLSNVFTNLNLSDMETCYKVFRGDLIRRLAPELREKRFGIEPELTARIARIPRVRVFERSIRYSGRTYAEGKKICWRDGVRAVWCIVRYGLIR